MSGSTATTLKYTVWAELEQDNDRSPEVRQNNSVSVGR